MWRQTDGETDRTERQGRETRERFTGVRQGSDLLIEKRGRERGSEQEPDQERKKEIEIERENERARDRE